MRLCDLGLLELAFRCIDKAAIAFKVQHFRLQFRLHALIHWAVRSVPILALRAVATLIAVTIIAVVVPLPVIAIVVASLITAAFAVLVTALIPGLVPLLLALRLVLVALGLTVAVLAFLLVAALVHLALRFCKQAQVMFGVLLEVFHRHPIIAKLCVTRQLVVFVDDLLRCTADFAFGTGTVKNAVDHVSDAAVRSIIAARLARP